MAHRDHPAGPGGSSSTEAKNGPKDERKTSGSPSPLRYSDRERRAVLGAAWRPRRWPRRRRRRGILALSFAKVSAKKLTLLGFSGGRQENPFGAGELFQGARHRYRLHRRPRHRFLCSLDGGRFVPRRFHDLCRGGRVPCDRCEWLPGQSVGRYDGRGSQANPVERPGRLMDYHHFGVLLM